MPREAKLCLERLRRLQRVLTKCGGSCTVRNLVRLYHMRSWEIEQAGEQGWITLELVKPAGKGRPSRVARLNTISDAAKVHPPRRNVLRREVSIRHELFAAECARIVSTSRGIGFALQDATSAYVRVFRSKNRRSAQAAASRLLRREDVRTARLWFLRTSCAGIEEAMPATVDGIRKRLRELGL